MDASDSSSSSSLPAPQTGVCAANVTVTKRERKRICMSKQMKRISCKCSRKIILAQPPSPQEAHLAAESEAYSSHNEHSDTAIVATYTPTEYKGTWRLLSPGLILCCVAEPPGNAQSGLPLKNGYWLEVRDGGEIGTIDPRTVLRFADGELFSAHNFLFANETTTGNTKKGFEGMLTFRVIVFSSGRWIKTPHCIVTRPTLIAKRQRQITTAASTTTTTTTATGLSTTPNSSFTPTSSPDSQSQSSPDVPHSESYLGPLNEDYGLNTLFHPLLL
ncbi:hypothetical protein Pelo_5569 [Pelomyxa schiedti]|nr:hypothetical protein Pelo_5569 [Pelomyxa schiedti]